MNNSRRFVSTKLEVYFLPDGATKGKDEIPLHSSRTSMTISDQTDWIDIPPGFDTPAQRIPGLKWWTVDLESVGAFRDVPRLVQLGGSGIITLLWGDQPYAKHMDSRIIEFSQGIKFDNLFTWKMHLNSQGPLFDGTYTCEQQYGRIQTDMADGTFLEQALVHMIPLDQLIDNRYHGWQS